MQWAALIALAMVPAIFIASLSVYADSCADAIKPAIGCPSGYTMTCLTEGYSRYECTKVVDGVVVPISSEVPQEQHDTIEKSVMDLGKASHRTESVVKSTTTPKKIRVEKEKREETQTADAKETHEESSGGWKSRLPSWLSWMFGGATSTEKKMPADSSSSTPSRFSNGYFAQLFGKLLGR